MAEKKTAPKKKPGRKVFKYYDVSGGVLKRKNKTCPRCGAGVMMANHQDRWTCGKCNFMEKK